MKHIKLFETFVYEDITITPKNTPKLNIVEKPKLNIVERPKEEISITRKDTPKLNIVKKEQMTEEEKLEELNKIVQNYGLFTNHGPMRTYDDYLKFKKEYPDFNYPRLDDELNSKKREMNFCFTRW